MVIYEVTAVVDVKLREEFEEFMTNAHIADVLSTGHFTRATFSRTGDRYRIQYEAKGPAELDEYLESAAPVLRTDFLRRFPTGIGLSRDTWEVVSTHVQ